MEIKNNKIVATPRSKYHKYLFGGSSSGSSSNGSISIDTNNFVKKTGETSQTVEGDFIANGAVVAKYMAETYVQDFPIATANLLGLIKVGANLTIDANGVLSATGGGSGVSSFNDLTDKPTTLSGYGISAADTLFDSKYAPFNHTHSQYLTSYINNYLTGVSGSGNGTITFTRNGLTNLTFNAAHTHSYLPMSGGIMTGGIAMTENILALSSSLSDNQTDGAPWYGLKKILADSYVKLSGYFGLRLKTSSNQLEIPHTGDLTYNANKIWHAGNFNPSNYLPLSGGTLTGSLSLTEGKNIMLRNAQSYLSGIGYDTYGYECIALWAENQTTRLRWHAGIDMSDTPFSKMMTITPDFEISKLSGVAIGYIGGNTIWNSGNDGAGSGLDADLLRGVAPSNLEVLSATKLANTRTIWGQDFNGEGNVDGALTLTNPENAIIRLNSKFNTSNNRNWDILTNASTWGDFNIRVSPSFDTVPSILAVTIKNNGYVGIGTSSPDYKLDVNGTFRTTGAAYLNSTLSVAGASTLTGLLTANGGIGSTTGAFSSYLTANRFYTGYDSGLANAFSCSNWFRSNGATGWLNETYTAGILSDTANIVRTYSTNKFKVHNTEADSIYTLGGIKADGNIVAAGAVVAKYQSSTYTTDWPTMTASLQGTAIAGPSLIMTGNTVNIRNRHYTTTSSFTDGKTRNITAKIALGTGSMTSGALDQIKLDFAPLGTTFGLTANVIATNTGAGMSLLLSFREDAGTGRWYLMIYNGTTASITKDGIYLSISAKQTV